MRGPRLRFTIRSVMIASAVAAALLIPVAWARQEDRGAMLLMVVTAALMVLIADSLFLVDRLEESPTRLEPRKGGKKPLPRLLAPFTRRAPPHKRDAP